MNETISILNDLIETLKDGQEGFRVAAEDIKNPELKTLFNKISLERSGFVGELQAEANRLGESKPENTSSVAGALHRTWINLKSSLSRGDEYEVLVDCERGEDSAVDEYKKALEKELPHNIREIVERQFREVKSAHDTVKQLRDVRAK